jgi:hypothetical protein
LLQLAHNNRLFLSSKAKKHKEPKNPQKRVLNIGDSVLKYF